MSGQRVTVEIADGVADVRLARPDKRNALDGAMFAGLVTAGERLKSEPGVRAVVLSGEGPDFCAGLDFGSFAAMRDGERLSLQVDLPPGHGPARATGQRAAYVWAEIPVPVIAAVTGNALGGGLQIALGADIRIVAPDTRMAIIELDWGMVPDMCGAHLMTRLARDETMRELLFTGRAFTGAEAVAMGLASRTADDPRTEALTLAAEIAAKSPDAVRAAKRLLNLARDADAEHLLMRETAEQVALFGAPNQVEAYKARIAGRTPRFVDAKT
jgi:enoyl-CoA hydratase/carnithine racemase